MTRAIATALLGAGLCLAAGTFDTPSLYLPGVALALLAGGAAVWVPLAASVLSHRLLLAPGSGSDERSAVVRDALDRVPAL